MRTSLQYYSEEEFPTTGERNVLQVSRKHRHHVNTGRSDDLSKFLVRLINHHMQTESKRVISRGLCLCPVNVSCSSDKILELRYSFLA